MMNNYLKDPKSFQDPILDLFFTNLKLQHKDAFEIFTKAQRKGIMVTIGTRLLQIRNRFLDTVGLIMNRIRKRTVHQIQPVTNVHVLVQNSIKEIMLQFEDVHKSFLITEKNFG